MESSSPDPMAADRCHLRALLGERGEIPRAQNLAVPSPRLHSDPKPSEATAAASLCPSLSLGIPSPSSPPLLFLSRDRNKSKWLFRVGGAEWLGSPLSVRRCIPSLDPHPLKHHHSFHHTQLEPGESMTGGPAGRRGWDIMASSPSPNKTDMSPLDVLGEIILTSTFVPGNQCV